MFLNWTEQNSPRASPPLQALQREVPSALHAACSDRKEQFSEEEVTWRQVEEVGNYCDSVSCPSELRRAVQLGQEEDRIWFARRPLQSSSALRYMFFKQGFLIDEMTLQ